MAFDQPVRIGLACRQGEFRTIDQVAAVGRQGDTIARLGVGGTRLRVLAGEAADANHGQAQAIDEHDAHLDQHLEPIGNQR